ncbi:MAG: hypothetical protein SGJ09_08900 [Phycisphaerae bacterium]|nr:hypothetical protein [Phycisphaerae bacterium]
MPLTPDTLLRYLAGDLTAADRAATELALSESAGLRGTLARIERAVATVRDDSHWEVPSAAIANAKALGRRLESLRAKPLTERVSDAILDLVARLTFDSRTQGALAGLRGGSGVALAFTSSEAEIEIECDLDDSDRVRVLGQIRVIAGGAFSTVQVYEADADAPAVTTSPVSQDGMFRLSLRSGAFRLRFLRAAGEPPLDLPVIKLP